LFLELKFSTRFPTTSFRPESGKSTDDESKGHATLITALSGDLRKRDSLILGEGSSLNVGSPQAVTNDEMFVLVGVIVVEVSV
jgi:hypothetical protein